MVAHLLLNGVMEQLILNAINKEDRYKELLPQIESIISCEEDIVANLANVAAMLKEAFDFFWVGFYIVKTNTSKRGDFNGKSEELVLGPFQGPLACTRIKYGRGVCGTAWKEARTLVVPDVEKFPGHIACSSLSRSEIVVPIFKDVLLESDTTLDHVNEIPQVKAVLDIDSKELSTFDDTDARYLEKLAAILSGRF